MVEIRISSIQGMVEHDDSKANMEVFVFDDEPDAVLVQRWQRGDLAAASIAIQRHESMVYAAVFRLLRNHANTEDISQDAFLHAHQRIDTLQQPAAFKGWLRKIAIRLAIDLLRRTEMVELKGEVADPFPGPESAFETLDALQRYRAMLDALPAAQKAVIVMRDVEGFSIKETAEKLEISEGAVKMRLSRARAALARVLQPSREMTND